MRAPASWKRLSWRVRAVVLIGGLWYLLLAVATLLALMGGGDSSIRVANLIAWVCVVLGYIAFFLLAVPRLASPGPRRGWRRWSLFSIMAFMTVVAGLTVASPLLLALFVLLAALLLVEAARGPVMPPEEA